MSPGPAIWNKPSATEATARGLGSLRSGELQEALRSARHVGTLHKIKTRAVSMDKVVAQAMLPQHTKAQHTTTSFLATHMHEPLHDRIADAPIGITGSACEKAPVPWPVSYSNIHWPHSRGYIGSAQAYPAQTASLVLLSHMGAATHAICLHSASLQSYMEHTYTQGLALPCWL